MIARIKNILISIKKYIGIALIENIPNNIFNAYSKIKYPKINRIHVIGDSHTSMFRYNHKYVVHHIGPITAYNWKNASSTTGSYLKLNKILMKIKEDSNIILVAGEIDCRIHIYNNYVKTNCYNSIESIIDKTVDRYIELSLTVKDKKYNVFLLRITPTKNQNNIYKYPYYGNNYERSNIRMYFNKKLKQECGENGLEFIDIFNFLVDENDELKSEFAKDEIHSNRKASKYVDYYFEGYFNKFKNESTIYDK